MQEVPPAASLSPPLSLSTVGNYTIIVINLNYDLLKKNPV